MRTTTVIDPFRIKANSICTDCASHTSLERYLISSIGFQQTQERRGAKRGGSSRLLELLTLTT